MKRLLAALVLTLVLCPSFAGADVITPTLAGAYTMVGTIKTAHPAALNGPQFLGASILTEPFVPVAGKVRVPKGPGLGVEVDEAKLAALVEQSRASK